MRLLVAAILLAATAASAAPFDVGRHQSSGAGPVNSWWIETPGGGLVVVDAQRSAEEARAAVGAIERAGKPVRAILITHPHPDHLTGLATLKEAFPKAPVIAQAGTREEMVQDTQGLLSIEGNPRPPVPDRIVTDAGFAIDGLRVEPRAMGSGESVAHTVYWLPQARTLVAGDLATPGLVPFLREGRTGAWLDQLARLKRRYPLDARLLPGHGSAGQLGLMVDAQTEYLRAYREAIAAALRVSSPAGTAVSPAERNALVRRMENRFGTGAAVAGLPIEQLHEWNADGVAGELRAAEEKRAR